MEVAPNGYTLLVLNVPAGKVSFISTLNQKLVGVVGVGGMPSDVMISKDSRIAYVSNRLSNTVSVIDVTQKKVLRTMQTGEGPTGMALSKDGARLFVANAKENSISVFDLKTHTKIKDVSLPIDVEFPSDIMLMPDGQHMLVTSAATDTLGMLNVETLEFEKQQTLGCTSVDLIWIPQ
jgi:YVTN family beta-propeller protein